MTFKPLQDRVLVRRLEEEEKTSAGIIIPDTAKEKPQRGEIVAVGPGARQDDGSRIPMAVEVGEQVLFAKWSGTEIAIERDEYLVLRESDILGVLEGKDSTRRKAA